MSPVDARKSRAVHFLPLTPWNYSLHSCGASCPAFTPDLACTALQQEPCYRPITKLAGSSSATSPGEKGLLSAAVLRTELLCVQNSGARNNFSLLKLFNWNRTGRKKSVSDWSLIHLFGAAHFQGSFSQSTDLIHRTSKHFQQIF